MTQSSEVVPELQNKNDHPLFIDVWRPYPMHTDDDNDDHDEGISSKSSDGNNSSSPGLDKEFPYQRRRTICFLLCEALGNDDRLSDIFAGMLLPPPWCPLGNDDLTTAPPAAVLRCRLEQAAEELDSKEWRESVVLMPLNLALTSGVYDARLRVAMKRLCRLLCVPWSVVQSREAMLSTLDMDDLKSNEAQDEKRADVVQRKNQRRFSVKRIAAVGAFSVVGGAALLFTGGLAAPVIAPAFAALVTATSATLGAVGSVGAAMLGGGALAAAFGAVLGLATHAAAMATLLTPFLTAANLTALFGVGGAGLAGYKGLRRTGETSRFVLRATSEVEELPPLDLQVEDASDLPLVESDDSSVTEEAADEAPRRSTADSSQSTAAGQAGSSQGGGKLSVITESVGALTSKVSVRVEQVKKQKQDDFNDEIFSKSLAGLTVPTYTVNVSLRNVAVSDALERRTRTNFLAVECHLDGVKLVLECLKLTYGVWAYVPPRNIPCGYAGICASHNKVARPTGAGGIVCYRLVPLTQTVATTVSESLSPGARTTADSISHMNSSAALFFKKEAHHLCLDGGLKIWILSQTTISGSEYLSVVVERPTSKWSKADVVKRLEADLVKRPTSYTIDGIVTIELSFFPKSRVSLRYHEALGRPNSFATGSFPLNQLNQRLEDIRNDVHRRRVLTVVLRNRSPHTIFLRKIQCAIGAPSSFQSMPSVLKPQEAAFAIFTNNPNSLEGAEAQITAEVIRSTGRGAVTGVLFAEVTTLGSCRCASAFHLDAYAQLPCPLHASGFLPSPSTTAGKPLAIPTLFDAEKGEPLTFVSATVKVNEQLNQVEWDFADAVDHIMLRENAAHRMTISVAVCGFMDAFDPRRLLSDQQLAVWQPILNGHALFAGSHGLSVDWEDQLLRDFSRTVGFVKSETVINRATAKLVANGKKQVKAQLLAGALFAGLRAFDALKGTIELPLYAVWATDAIDNTFATLWNRAEFAGKDLAAALLSDQRGHRPVTLVGYSFGSTVIAECLKELCHQKAFGIVENVYLLGSIVPADRHEWLEMRQAVAGRLVNVYNRRDWLLWGLYKANGLRLKPLAGLTAVQGVEGVENVDASSLTDSHASYAIKLKAILDLIPDWPNEVTMQQDPDGGSQGALVPLGEVSTTVERLYASMSMPMFEYDVCVIGMINKSCGSSADADLLADLSTLTSKRDLVYAGSRMHHGTFDFKPVPRIPCNMCGLSGVIRRDAVPREGSDTEKDVDGDICGVLGYALHIAPPLTGTPSKATPSPKMSVLVMIFFHCKKRTSRGVAAHAVAMTVPWRLEESQDSMQHRLCELIDNHGESSEEIVRIADSGPCKGDTSTSTFSLYDDKAASPSWSLSLTISDEGCAVVTLTGTAEASKIDLLRDAQMRQVSEDPDQWSSCPPTHNNPILLEEIVTVMEAVVTWGLTTCASEIYGSSQESVAASRDQAATHIVVPMIVVNVGDTAMSLEDADVLWDESAGTRRSGLSSSAVNWIRPLTSTLPADHATIGVIRIPVPHADQFSKGRSSHSDLCGSFSYATDAVCHHFLIKVEWKALQHDDDASTTVPMTDDKTKISSAELPPLRLSFNVAMQCLSERRLDTQESESTSMMDQTANSSTCDVKTMHGVSFHFSAIRDLTASNPSANSTKDQSSPTRASPGGTADVASPPDGIETPSSAEDDLKWISFA